MIKTIPCPVCRGEIHAIAGRCKHCKADLVELRERAVRAARAHAIGATVPPRPMFMPPPPVAGPPPGGDATGQQAAEPMPPSMPTMVELEPAHLPPMLPHYAPAPGGWAESRASRWSRRWPLMVSAVALLAIGISIGMLAERWRHGHADAGDGRVRNASAQPHRVPDHMPQPLLPGPGAPRMVPDPAPSPGSQSTDPQSNAPAPSGPFAMPAPPSSPSPPQGGDAGAFRTFTTNLTDSLCRKLTDCGLIGSATQSMCQAFADEFDAGDAAAKVARGECSFNQRAADACLRAVADLRCDATSSSGMMDWLTTSQNMAECAEAFTCL